MVVMSPPIGRAVLALSGLGFPLTQLAIRRFGRPGAFAVEVVCGGLLVRDAAMIAAGVQGRLRRGPAILLWLEAAVAGTAAATTLRPVVDAAALLRAAGQARPDRLEAARRCHRGAVRAAHHAVPHLPATRFRAHTPRPARRIPVSST
ncbi:MAG TPA: hypothetical protein VFC16_14860 [Nakamurella sp.]|nr:hypothetical protein [Nakamurella sp.]